MLAMLLLSVAATSGALEIRVFNPDGTPAAGAAVEVRRNTVPMSAITGPDGVATFAGRADESGRRRLTTSTWRTRALAADGSLGYARAVHPPTDGLTLEPVVTKPVRVLDGEGRPVANAFVGYAGPWDREKNSRGSTDLQTTDADGRATLILPAAPLEQDEPGKFVFYAMKHGVGFDYFIRGTLYDGREAGPVDGPMEFTLSGTRPASVRFTDEDGEPVAGVDTYLWLLMKPGELDDFNFSDATDLQHDRVSGEDGLVEFPFVPTWNTRGVTVWPDADGYVRDRVSFQLEEEMPRPVTLRRFRKLYGHVSDSDGEPVAGAEVIVRLASFGIDDFGASPQTDKNGDFSVSVPPDMFGMVLAQKGDLVSEMSLPFTTTDADGAAAEELVLRDGLKLSGRVTRPNGDPVEDQTVEVYQRGPPLNDSGLTIPNPEGSTLYVRPYYVRWLKTDAEGQYETTIGPGSFYVIGSRQQESKEFDAHRGDPPREIDFVVPEPYVEFTLTVTDDGQPADGAKVEGDYAGDSKGFFSEGRTDANGQFAFRRERVKAVAVARSADGQKAGLVKVPKDAAAASIELRPTSLATGRLRRPNGEPAADQKLTYGIRVPSSDQPNGPFGIRFGGKATTDETGAFLIEGLIRGVTYEFSVPTERGSYRVAEATSGAGVLDLGDLDLRGN